MPASQPPAIICVGSALWDTIASAGGRMKPGYDIAGRIQRRPGGVALNIALALAARGRPVALLSAIGTDPQGDTLVAQVSSAGVDCTHVLRNRDRTDNYLAIETPDGEVFGAIADCASLEKAGDRILAPLRDGRMAGHGPVIVDGNLPAAVIATLASDAGFAGKRMTFVPASPGKAERLRAALNTGRGTIFVNRTEAQILCGARFANAASAAQALCRIGAFRAVVTDGPRPAALCFADSTVTATPPQVEATTTTGAGDVFLASFIAAEVSTAADGFATGTHARTILQTAADSAAAHVTKDGK